MLANIEAERARLRLKQEEVAKELGITGKTLYSSGWPVCSNALLITCLD